MVNKYHIYLLKTGRIAIVGLNDKNVDYVANAMHDVSKWSSNNKSVLMNIKTSHVYEIVFFFII